MDIQKLLKQLNNDFDKKVVRTLKDLKRSFRNTQKVKNVLERKNPIIYTVYSKDLGKGKIVALTILNPGKIDKEFYMTRGHKHRRNIAEDYILIKGKGKLLLQNKKKIDVIEMKKNKKINVPGKVAHRAINIGKNKLEFISIYDKKSGHLYKIKFLKRFFGK